MSLVPLIVVVVVVTLCIAATVGNNTLNDTDTAIKFLKEYGYMEKSIDTRSALLSNVSDAEFRHALALFQEYYRLPGDGKLNDVTMNQMRRPRCGVPDFFSNDVSNLRPKWPKTHITWNFHLADAATLRTTEAAFEIWEANSTLTFTRDAIHPDILISYSEGIHFNIAREKRSYLCNDAFDGPGGILGHAYFPTGERDYIAEVHIDKTEPWYIHIDRNPPKKLSLMYVLTHEIGHSLGLSHSERNDSLMFSYIPDVQYPVTLSLEDQLRIQRLYGYNRRRTTTEKPAYIPQHMPTDPCALQDVDSVLIANKRIYIAFGQYVWPIDVNGKVYAAPTLLKNYMKFLPDDFSNVTAVYQNPNSNIVMFVRDKVYMVEYPSFELVHGWPKTLKDFGLPMDATINAAVNTHRGRSYVFYNDHFVGEIDECSMRVSRHHAIQTIFPGIPNSIRSAYRYIDGNLYFLQREQYYTFNEFTETVTKAGKFDLGVLGVTCPRDGLLRQLRDLMNRLVLLGSLQ